MSHSIRTTRPAVRGRRVRRRRDLPGTVLASGGLTAPETAVFSTVVPALSFPLLLATMGASWAAVAVLAISAVVIWLCLARRVLIGDGWIADRRLWSFRVTGAADLRAVELVENGHGGVLRLHPVQGRPHRLRRPEFESAQAQAALGSLVTRSAPALDGRVAEVLHLQPAPGHALTGAAA